MVYSTGVQQKPPPVPDCKRMKSMLEGPPANSLRFEQHDPPFKNFYSSWTKFWTRTRKFPWSVALSIFVGVWIVCFILLGQGIALSMRRGGYDLPFVQVYVVAIAAIFIALLAFGLSSIILYFTPKPAPPSEKYLTKAQRKIKIAWILGIIVSSITFSIGWIGMVLQIEDWYMGLIDFAILAGLTFGIYKYSRVCGVILFIYFAADKVDVLARTGNISGLIWGLAIAFIFWRGVVGLFQYHIAQNHFAAHPKIPQLEISSPSSDIVGDYT